MEEDLTLKKKCSLPQREKEKGNSNPKLRCESDAAGFFAKVSSGLSIRSNGVSIPESALVVDAVGSWRSCCLDQA